MNYGMILMIALVVFFIVVSMIVWTYMKAKHLPLHIMSTVVVCYLLAPSINIVAKSLGVDEFAIPGPGWSGAWVVSASVVALLLIQYFMLRRDTRRMELDSERALDRQRSEANDHLIEQLHCVLDGLKDQKDVDSIADNLGISKQRVILIIRFIAHVETRVVTDAARQRYS